MTITMDQAKAAQEKVLAGWDSDWTTCGIGMKGGELCITVGLRIEPDGSHTLTEVDGVTVVYKHVDMPYFS